MTEAQINEQNKSNPLTGFGFMSAQQKQQRALEQQLLEREQQRQQDMLQKQLIAQMSSQEKIGYYSGSGLMGLMQYLKNKGSAPEVPNAPPTNDPELDRFNELATQVGPETAMQILGQETGNAGMIQQANQQLMDRQKKQMELEKMGLDMTNTRGLIDERKAKPNSIITTQATGPDGRPLQVSKEVLGKDPLTGQNRYKDLGSAVKGSLTVDDPAKFGTSKQGVNKRTEDMEGMLTGTANALDTYELLDKLVKETPANGWAGALVSKADDIVSGVQNLSTLLADQEGASDVSKSLGDYDFSKMEKFAGGAAKIKSAVLELAYARALTAERGGKTLSEGDIQRQIDQIGGSISNPKIFGELMEQNKIAMIKKLENFGEMTMVDGQSIGEAPQYKAKIQKLKGRVKTSDQDSNDPEYQEYLKLRKKHKGY
jgi:hypothetical protein